MENHKIKNRIAQHYLRNTLIAFLLHKKFLVLPCILLLLGLTNQLRGQCNISAPTTQFCRSSKVYSLDSLFRVNGMTPKSAAYSIYAFDGNTGHAYVTAYTLLNGKQFGADWPAGRWSFKISASCGKSDTILVVLKAEPILKATLKKGLRFCSALDTVRLTSFIDTVQPTGGTWSWKGQISGNLLLLPRLSDSIWSKPQTLVGLYTSPMGCCDSSSTTYLIRNKPLLSISSFQPSKLCENDSLRLNCNFKAATSINWSTFNYSDGFFTNPNSASTVYLHGKNDLTEKQIQVVLASQPVTMDVCGQATDSLTVPLSAFPIPGMGDSIRICQNGVGSIVGFEKSKIPGAHLKYQWICNPGNVVDSGIFFIRRFQNQGKYDLSVTVKNIKTGCKATLMKKEWIWALPVPKADFGMVNSNFAMVYNPKFYFENKSSIDKSYFKNASMQYEWIFENWRYKETRAEANPIYVAPPDTGYINVTLVTSGLGNCFDTAKAAIYVADNPWALMPTAFSPDEEGPRPNNLYMVQMGYAKEVKLSIFNIWGERLFYTEDLSHGWDGKYKGAECPQGVYIAAAEVKDLLGYRKVFSQSFHLLR